MIAFNLLSFGLVGLAGHDNFLRLCTKFRHQLKQQKLKCSIDDRRVSVEDENLHHFGRVKYKLPLDEHDNEGQWNA